VQLPADWTSLPELAESARLAAVSGAGDVEVTVQGWGDPSSGVFALLARTSSGTEGGAEELLSRLRSDLEGAGVQVEGGGEESFTFAWGSFRGVARAAVDEDDGRLQAAILACFHSAREPTRSRATCQAFMGRFEEML